MNEELIKEMGNRIATLTSPQNLDIVNETPYLSGMKQAFYTIKDYCKNQVSREELIQELQNWIDALPKDKTKELWQLDVADSFTRGYWSGLNQVKEELKQNFFTPKHEN